MGSTLFNSSKQLETYKYTLQEKRKDKKKTKNIGARKIMEIIIGEVTGGSMDMKMVLVQTPEPVRTP